MAVVNCVALGTEDKSVPVANCMALGTQDKSVPVTNCMTLGTQDKSVWLSQIVWHWAHRIKVYGCRKLYGFGHTG